MYTHCKTHISDRSVVSVGIVSWRRSLITCRRVQLSGTELKLSSNRRTRTVRRYELCACGHKSNFSSLNLVRLLFILVHQLLEQNTAPN